MNKVLREHAERIIKKSIEAVQPDAAVKKALGASNYKGRVLLVAAGKAAWQMSKAAFDCLGDKLEDGVVITKYGHVKGSISNFKLFEAGHPIPDENSFKGTQAALDMVSDLSAEDTVIFLLSGGGSALFEKPLIPGEELQNITGQLLACGADIVEINTIRKRLSAVKGGKFAKICYPAKIEAVILSDILGDPLDMIASGPACRDSATSEDAKRICKKYDIVMSDDARKLLDVETPKVINNVETHINGSVSELCKAAASECEALGYKTVILTDLMCCQAREAGSFISSVLRTHSKDKIRIAFIAGGETVVKLTGKGIGGRNQETALSAASGITGLYNVALFSVGSDGTDGPTDAAGGYCDGYTFEELKIKGIDISEVLQNNDSYNALKETDGLIFTGPTGTNVNDLAVGLIYY